MEKPIKVLIVDDHRLVRYAFKHLLSDHDDIQVIADVGSGEEALQFVGERMPDIVLMDINLPGISGIEALRQLRAAYPHLKIIVISYYRHYPYPRLAFESGAVGYLTKDSRPDLFLHAIRLAMTGQRYIAPSIAQDLALQKNTYRKESPLAQLSTRQLQVMQRVVTGESMQKIASELCLSKKSISSYRSQIFNKLQVETDVGLLLFAKRLGLID